MQERKLSKSFLRNTGLVLDGFILVFSPVVLRNAAVGAPTDYNNLYEIQYMGRIKSDAKAGKWKEAISAHTEFLEYQPGIVASVKPNQLLQSASDIEWANYFAKHCQIHGFLYEGSGNREQAAKEMAKHQIMKQVVENSRRRLGR